MRYFGFQSAAAIAWFFVWFGLTLGSIEDVPKCKDTPYGWEVLVAFFASFGVSMVLGFFAGLEHEENSGSKPNANP